MIGAPASLLLGLTLGSALGLELGGPDDEVCASIRMGDGDLSFEQRAREGGSQVLGGLLARVIDRLESRGCYRRSIELLDLLEARAIELELSESDPPLAELRARIELIRARVQLRDSCPELRCDNSCGTQLLTAYLDAHPELEAREVETWLVAEQSEELGEPLRCVLERAREELEHSEGEPPPPLLPPSGQDEGEPGRDPRRLPPMRWGVQQRRTAIALAAVGVTLGVGAMIAGGVFFAVDERCPGGQEPNQCRYRFSTTEEGALTMSIGGALLVGSGVGLGAALLRPPDSGRRAHAPARGQGWGLGLSWSGRF